MIRRSLFLLLVGACLVVARGKRMRRVTAELQITRSDRP